MKTFMLGWEFPPFISGGLGTACYGISKALDKLGVEITFVLPKANPAHHAGHIKLMGGAGAGDSIRPVQEHKILHNRFIAAALHKS